MTKFQVETRFVTTRPLAYNDAGTGLPESWERQNGCVIVPAGTGGMVIGAGHGRGQRSVRFDGCGDHRSFNLSFDGMTPA